MIALGLKAFKKAINEDAQRRIAVDPMMLQIEALLQIQAQKPLDHSPSGYKKAKILLSKLPKSSIAEIFLVPFVICNILKQKPKKLSDIENYPDLIDFLKACKEKNFDFCNKTFLSIFLMRYTPLVILLYEKLDFNIKQPIGPSGMTVFHIGSLAPDCGQIYFKMGLEHKVDPNQQESEGWCNTALHNIVANENHQLLIMFLVLCMKHNVKLDLTRKDSQGKNILILAAKMRATITFHYILQFLKEKSHLFNVNWADFDNMGRNGLHYACMHRAFSMIKHFAVGRAAEKEDCNGKRPIDYLISTDEKQLKMVLNEVSMRPNDIREQVDTVPTSNWESFMTFVGIKDRKSKPIKFFSNDPNSFVRSVQIMREKKMLTAENDNRVARKLASQRSRSHCDKYRTYYTLFATGVITAAVVGQAYIKGFTMK